MKNLLLTFILLHTCFNSSAQQDPYDQLKTHYDRLRKEAKHDSALVVAKQMSNWALQNETDTSLRYAVTMQLIGRSFYNLQVFDSSKYYYEKTLHLLDLQNRYTSLEYTETLNSLGIIHRNLGNFKNAEKSYLKAISIRDSLPTKQGHKPKYQNNLGFLYLHIGLYDEAETNIMSSLKRFNELYGVDTSKYIPITIQGDNNRFVKTNNGQNSHFAFRLV